MARKSTKFQWEATDNDSEDQWVSRSRKKRDSTALQQMGEELCALGENQLRAFNLPEVLLTAILEWKRISDHEGRRRQGQYIGRLMREEADPVTVRAGLDAIAEGHAVDAQRLKRVERLRETLMEASAPQLAELCAPLGEHAEAASDLVLKARAEAADGRPPHSFRALFRFLREHMA